LKPLPPGAEATILPSHSAALFRVAVERAAEILRAGEPVALPTETVYGLAANALDARAVARIFEIKGRPAHNPIIVHVAGYEMARTCVAAWPDSASRLSRAFWPGPLTLVLARSSEIPDIVTAGGGTVGIRWPSHPFIQAVIRECGFPLAAPSANPSNSVSPTNAEHVRRLLGTRIRLIVDGGQSQVGIESTVVDVTGDPLRILRPGMIGLGALRAAVAGGGVDVTDDTAAVSQGTLRSPGRLLKHYSPRAKVRILSWRDETELNRIVHDQRMRAGKTYVIAHTVIPGSSEFGGVSVIPHDPEAFARALYSELHQCDESGAEWIIVEALPEGEEWQAIADRLRRAAG